MILTKKIDKEDSSTSEEEEDRYNSENMIVDSIRRV